MRQQSVASKIEPVLYRVKKPGRYVGGEFGSLRKDDALLRIALSYPDLYEVGMCNLAVRMLYHRMNAVDGVGCERVFAPERDLEEELRGAGLPLFSLEACRPLSEFDIIGFSIGYELTYTNVLNILDLGRISLESEGRGADEPIVLASGPGITNPLPMARFFDAVFIGEGEVWVDETLPRLVRIKERGGGRSDLLEAVLEHSAVWTPQKAVRGKTRRALVPTVTRAGPFTPVPSVRIIQDHGVVEIMRGCPNGCRFCHAGFFYRPPRMKMPEDILGEADELVLRCGYREITLSSLSSGDYVHIGPLVGALSERYGALGVSFSVPSLRVDSMALGLLSALSRVRKSGLTFAVETPLADWQKAINKTVSLDHTVRILQEAKKLGWNKAKFYFMLGLPVASEGDEVRAIVDSLIHVEKATGMMLHINLASFIPKPHTPFQWERQMGEEEALEKINGVRRLLRRRRIKVGYHAPFASCVEGVLSRGDDRAARLVYNAFAKGARLDAWEEHFDWAVWRGAFEEADWDVLDESLRARSPQEALPWDSVDLGVSRSVLLEERKRAGRLLLTEPCRADCPHPCGVCGKSVRVRSPKLDLPASVSAPLKPPLSEPRRFLLCLAKSGKAVFLSHLDTMTILERSLLRAGLFPVFTQGFNPKPRMEFASPLSLGISSEQEIISADLYSEGRRLAEKLSAALPDGFEVRMAASIDRRRQPRSLMALFWGSSYRIRPGSGRSLWEELCGLLSGQRPPAQAASAGAPDAGAPANESERPLQLDALRGEELHVIHRMAPGKGAGLLKVLSRMLDAKPLERGMRIHRTATWADGGPAGPVSYFDLLV